MTFSTRLKEEITSSSLNYVSTYSELSAIIRYDAAIKENSITLTFENASVARRVFKDIKSLFNIVPKIIVRNQKRFRAKQIYILEIKDNVKEILKKLNIYDNGNFLEMNSNYLLDKEEKKDFVRCAFLVIGSINDPSTSGYHLEFVFNKLNDASFMNNLLHEMKFDSKVIERGNHYMLYLKSSEEISDMIRMFGASNSLFYFEDIRIYRDHKNMVNRLNNCEIANQEKSTKTGMEQLELIKFLRDNDLVELLEEKTKLVLEYREKYPESSYQELADIISVETDYHIGKSGINHHFIKMKKLKNKFLENEKNE